MHPHLPSTRNLTAPPVSDPGRVVEELAAGEPLSAEEAAYVAAARAQNTMRGYASDWREFTAWCAQHDRAPLPAAASTVTAYLSDLAAAGAKVGTMSRRLSAHRPSPRAHAIPDMKTLNRLVKACSKAHHSYSDFVMLAALLAARSSEVSGLQVGDVDFGKNLVVIRRQVFPGKGGLVTTPTKSRKERRVPILEPLRPVLDRLTEGKQPEDSLLVGPKGGYLTTATVRDATDWDRSSRGSDCPTSPATACATPGRPGWPTPASRCTCCKTSSATPQWKPPAAISTPTTGISSAAEQANAFLSAAGQRKQARRSGPSAKGL